MRITNHVFARYVDTNEKFMFTVNDTIFNIGDVLKDENSREYIVEDEAIEAGGDISCEEMYMARYF